MHKDDNIESIKSNMTVKSCDAINDPARCLYKSNLS
jgi:hypothetical protein